MLGDLQIYEIEDFEEESKIQILCGKQIEIHFWFFFFPTVSGVEIKSDINSKYAKVPNRNLIP